MCLEKKFSQFQHILDVFHSILLKLRGPATSKIVSTVLIAASQGKYIRKSNKCGQEYKGTKYIGKSN